VEREIKQQYGSIKYDKHDTPPSLLTDTGPTSPV